MRQYRYAMKSLELKLPPLAVLVLAAVAMWASPAIAALPRGGISIAMSAVLALLGGAICVAGVLAFRDARTTVDPMHPSAATSLVERGIYRYSRNPMYLGFVIILLAWALFLGKLSAFASIPIFMAYLTVFQIKPEERALREQFANAFEEYASRVRRWL